MAQEANFDKWAVLKGSEAKEEEFVLAFQDSSLPQNKPFMHTSEPMSEEDIRKELEKMNVSKADADAAIAKARSS